MATLIQLRRSRKGNIYAKHIHLSDAQLLDTFNFNNTDSLSDAFDIFADTRASDDFEEIYIKDMIEKICEFARFTDFERRVFKLWLLGLKVEEIARKLQTTRYKVDYALKQKIPQKIKKLKRRRMWRYLKER